MEKYAIKTTNDINRGYDIAFNSISPIWDRLAKPKFISPKASVNSSLLEIVEQNKLPSLNSTKFEIKEVKNLKSKKKLKDPFSDPRLIVYKSSATPKLFK